MNFYQPGEAACRIRTDPAGNWRVVPPVGQFFRFGSIGDPSIVGDQQSVFISNSLEVGSDLTSGDSVLKKLYMRGTGHSFLYLLQANEEITIPVGQGQAGVDGAAHFQPRRLIFAVSARVTQAPGGGATTWSMHRKNGQPREFADTMPVALGTTSVWYGDFWPTSDHLLFQDVLDNIQVQTNLNVTGTPMKIRFEMFDWNNGPPSS